jgi:hypothetical protein
MLTPWSRSDQQNAARNGAGIRGVASIKESVCNLDRVAHGIKLIERSDHEFEERFALSLPILDHLGATGDLDDGPDVIR